MDDQNFSYVDFNKNAELKLIIKRQDNKTINSFELIEFNANFALNAIPDCTCLVSTGRSANSVNEIAEIHRFTNKNYRLLPAEVVLRLQNKKITLFDGYLTSISPHRSNNRFSVAVHLVHWLKDLDSFNLITNLTHMSHPFDLGNLIFFPLSLLGLPTTFSPNLSGNNNLGVGLLSFIDTIMKRSKTNDQKLDLWKFIKNFFLTLARGKTFMNFNCMSRGVSGQQQQLPSSQQQPPSLLETTNEEIKKALEKIGNEKVYTINNKTAKLYKKIVLKDPSLENLIYGGLKTFIAAQQTSNLSSNTVWAKLIGELFPLLFLNIIPTCSDATVSVVLPYYKPNNNLMVIGTEDYYSIQTVSSFHHPLKGVFVIPPGQHVLTFGGPIVQTMGGNQGPYGNFICYINDKIEEKGSYIIIKSPPIINLADLHSLNDQVIDFIRLYAKQFYFTEVLKEHSATVSLPFRYDIAPGSLVIVRGAGEKFITEDKIVYDIIGLVVKVTLTLNASEAMANTNIMLSYVRDAKDDSFYLSEHPLFDIESIPNGDGKEGGYAHWLPLANEE